MTGVRGAKRHMLVNGSMAASLRVHVYAHGVDLGDRVAWLASVAPISTVRAKVKLVLEVCGRTNLQQLRVGFLASLSAPGTINRYLSRHSKVRMNTRALCCARA